MSRLFHTFLLLFLVDVTCFTRYIRNLDQLHTKKAVRDLKFDIDYLTFVEKRLSLLSLKVVNNGNEINSNEFENDEEDEKIIDEDESIESLYRRAMQEQEDSISQERNEEKEKRRNIIKLKKDKEYEAYWSKKGSEGDSKDGYSDRDAATQLLYYSMMDESTSALNNFKKKKNINGNFNASSTSKASETIRKLTESSKNEWDYNIKPMSAKEKSIATGAIASSVAALLAAQFISSRSSSSSSSSGLQALIPSGARILDKRMIKRNYSIEDFIKSLKELSGSNAVQSLPELPPSIYKLRGKDSDGSSPLSSILSETFKGTTVIVFWRPSDIFSVRVALLMDAFGKLFPDILKVLKLYYMKHIICHIYYMLIVTCIYVHIYVCV
jgi:hypothetical protein